jgi:hypothetical protein
MKKIITLLLLCGFIYNCEKDDICAEDTLTTPKLIIRFYDNTDPDLTKTVRRLTVTPEGFDEATESIIFNSDTDSITIPLRFQDEGIVTSTRYILKKDTDFDSDGDDNTVSNIDIIEVIYTPEFIYVSRACGYKSIFNDTSILTEPDSENWVRNVLVINTTIEQQDAAQIRIFH